MALYATTTSSTKRTLFLIVLQGLAVMSSPIFLPSFDNQRQYGAENASYTFYWTYNTTRIVFEVQINYGSWGLFGIQDPNVSTNNDAALFWINNEGVGYFASVSLNPDNSYTVNPEPHWLPMNAVRINKTFVFQFGRDIKLDCSNNTNNTMWGSIDFVPGNMTVIYSVGNQVDLYHLVATIDSAVNSESVTFLNSADGPFVCPPVATVATFDSQPTGNYDNHIDLMDGGMARIYWNYDSTTFTGELHVRTSGWVSFGFSPSGDMAGSNVMVFWAEQDNTPNFSERYLTGLPMPGANRITANQTWTLLYFTFYNGYTIVKFQRPIALCGPQQQTILTGTPYSVFAFGDKPAAGQDITYHGPFSRGSRQAAFVSTENPVQSAPADSETYDFSMSNIILPYTKTTYYCYPFEVPALFDVKRHIYSFEVVLPEINLRNIHHILLYECPRDIYNGTPALMPDSCGVTLRECPIVSLAWAVGGNTLQLFPSDTGYPIGGDSDYKFFLIQLHYDNPEQKLGYVPKLSIRYYMTQYLRPNELGVLTLGTGTDSYGIAIPPGISNFTINTYCTNGCIGQKLSQLGQNITAVSSLLHTHLVGTSVSTKILRNGQMIGFLSKNLYYSFNYQYNLAINPRINITKNDALITTCTYNTQSRTGFTFGGEETSDEMCFNFVMYYPRNKLLRTCLSLPTFGSYINLFTNLTRSGDMNVSAASFSSTSRALQAAYSTVRVTDNLRNVYKEFFEKTQTLESCDRSFNPGPLNPLTYTNSYTEMTLCQSLSVPNSTQSPSTWTSTMTTTTMPSWTTTTRPQTVIQRITNFFDNLWSRFRDFFNF